MGNCAWSDSRFWLHLLAIVMLLSPDWGAETLHAENQTLPRLAGRIHDSTATLSPDEIADLNAKLSTLESRTGSQLVVVILRTTGREAIEQYSIRLAEAWKIGRAGVDDGVILLIAKEDRKLRIEVGYGLEGAIPDARAKQIIDRQIVPRFRDGDFAGGLHAGVDALSALIRGEDLPALSAPAPEKQFEATTYVMLIISTVLGLLGCFVALLFGTRKLGYFVLFAWSVSVSSNVGLFFYGGFEWSLIQHESLIMFSGILAFLGGMIGGFVMLFGQSNRAAGSGSGSSSRGSSSSASTSGGSSFSSSSYSSGSSFSSSSGGSSFSSGGGDFGGGGASGSW